MSVTAENAIRIMLARVLQSSRGNLRRHSQPVRIQPINQPHDGLAFEVEFLQPEIERSAHLAEPHIIHLEAVELMAVNRDVAPALVLPSIMLVDANANQVRHDVGKPMVVVAFYPHDLYVALRI